MRNTNGDINGRELLHAVVWEISKLKIFLDAGLNRHFDINDPYTSEEYEPLEELGIQLFKDRYYRHFEELVLSIEGDNNIRQVITNIKKVIFFFKSKDKPHSYEVKNIYRDGVPVGSLVVKTEKVNQWVSENITKDLSEQVPKLEQLLEIFPTGEVDSIGGYSVPTVAMALIIKGITITKKGVGTKDGINYTERFKIKSINTLYKEHNNLIKDPLAQKNYRSKAEELIKNEGL